jgi:hypothetical protein
MFAVGAEALNNVVVWQTVHEHLIDFIAEGFGESGDVAVTSVCWLA